MKIKKKAFVDKGAEKRYRKVKVNSLFVDREAIKSLKHNEQRSFMAYTYESEYVKEHRDSFCEIKAIFFVPMGMEETINKTEREKRMLMRELTKGIRALDVGEFL